MTERESGFCAIIIYDTCIHVHYDYNGDELLK